MQASELVDLDQYPIDRPDDPACRALVERCYNALAQDSTCMLPGFVPRDKVQAMAAEAAELAREAYSLCNMRTPYGWMHNLDFPPDHPRRALFLQKTHPVLTHQFNPDSLINRLYHWDALTDFVRAVLGHDRLYRSECPHMSLMMTAMHPGDELGWHFDTNDSSMSLLLQGSSQGGDFEYAPYIRAEDDENYPTMARLFAEKAGVAKRADFRPGTFVLFRGRRTAHRVTRIGRDSQSRLIALFSYDTEPGMVFPPETCRDMMDESTAPYYGQLAPLA